MAYLVEGELWHAIMTEAFVWTQPYTNAPRHGDQAGHSL